MSSPATVRFNRCVVFPELKISGGHSVVCRHMKAFTVIREQETEGGLTQSHRPFQHRFEHWREIAGRRVDDLQYLRSGGLPLQRLLLLGQQACVFHRDHRLRGEAFQQGNLGFGERARFPAKDRDEADHGAVLEQRHLQKRADAAQFDQGVAHTGGGRQEFIGHDIRGLDRLLRSQCLARSGRRSW